MPKNWESQTNQPESLTSLPVPDLSDSQWSTLGNSVMQLIDINLGNRQQLDDFLDYGNAMYEMRTAPRNSPWEGAANIVVPIVAAEVDEMASRITGSAIQPRPFTVRGNDPRSSQYAHLVEQFTNAEFDKNNWYDAADTCIHLSCRDGTSVLECMWDLSIVEKTVMIDGPVVGEDGQPQIDNSGQPIMKKQRQRVRMTKWDAPRWTAVELRDFMLIPNFAPSIEAADGVARKRYLSEADMWAMVKAGAFNAEQTERVLKYVSTGQGDLSYDRQGYSTYTVSNRINVVDSAVAAPDNINMSRGPVEIWQVLTNQFDLDGDGVPEENFIWVHDRSRLMVGFAPFEYEHGRPYFDLSVMPRPNRFYGFSVPERVRGVQEEANAQHNGRLDWMDLSLNPTMYKTTGARIDDEDRKIGPGALWEVQEPNDVGYITLPDTPPSSVQEENILISYAARATGAPQTSGMPSAASGGRISARAAQQMAAIQGMQTNKMLTRVRRWLLRIFKYSFALYIRYGKNQMDTVATTEAGNERITVPREILALDYTLGVAGLGGPLDKDARRQDAMLMYQMLSQSPLVSGNLPRMWSLMRMVLETFDVPEVTSLIGTMDQAAQQQQAQAQAAQQQGQQQMLMQVLSHNKVKPQGAVNAGPGTN